MDSVKPWIESRITQLVEMDDEFLINLAISYLEEKQEEGQALCPKRICVHLTGKLLVS
jgi:hypothetical protein